jgi:hypothetical protein
MSQPDPNLHREAFIFMKREQQNHSSMFLTEEEYFTVPAKPYAPGIKDTIMLNFGDWLIKIGNELRTRSIHTKLSEEQACVN